MTMNKSFLHAAVGLGLVASAAGQTTLQLEVTTAQGPVVHVVAGATVDYEVTGLLGGDASQGLCMFAFDVMWGRFVDLLLTRHVPNHFNHTYARTIAFL